MYRIRSIIYLIIHTEIIVFIYFEILIMNVYWLDTTTDTTNTGRVDEFRE